MSKEGGHTILSKEKEWTVRVYFCWLYHFHLKPVFRRMVKNIFLLNTKLTAQLRLSYLMVIKSFWLWRFAASLKEQSFSRDLPQEYQVRLQVCWWSRTTGSTRVPRLRPLLWRSTVSPVQPFNTVSVLHFSLEEAETLYTHKIYYKNHTSTLFGMLKIYPFVLLYV